MVTVADSYPGIAGSILTNMISQMAYFFIIIFVLPILLLFEKYTYISILKYRAVRILGS